MKMLLRTSAVVAWTTAAAALLPTIANASDFVVRLGQIGGTLEEPTLEFNAPIDVFSDRDLVLAYGYTDGAPEWFADAWVFLLISTYHEGGASAQCAVSTPNFLGAPAPATLGDAMPGNPLGLDSSVLSKPLGVRSERVTELADILAVNPDAARYYGQSTPVVEVDAPETLKEWRAWTADWAFGGTSFAVWTDAYTRRFSAAQPLHMLAPGRVVQAAIKQQADSLTCAQNYLRTDFADHMRPQATAGGFYLAVQALAIAADSPNGPIQDPAGTPGPVQADLSFTFIVHVRPAKLDPPPLTQPGCLTNAGVIAHGGPGEEIIFALGLASTADGVVFQSTEEPNVELEPVPLDRSAGLLGFGVANIPEKSAFDRVLGFVNSDPQNETDFPVFPPTLPSPAVD